MCVSTILADRVWKVARDWSRNGRKERREEEEGREEKQRNLV